MSALLAVESLTLQYPAPTGMVRVLDGVSFTIAPGETLGLAGESGSGKSQIALALMGLLPARARLSGQIHFEGQQLTALPASARRTLYGRRIALVPQDPMTSLNPHLTIGVQMAEVLEVHAGASRVQALNAAAQMLDAVRIPQSRQRLSHYPHQLSGGQRQRVMIAMMLLAKPALLIADEPTTALDVTVQAELLALLKDLQRELGLSLLMISHDLGVMAELADRLLVLYAGRVMEQGRADALLRLPGHPYTQALLACRPTLEAPLYLAEGRPLPSIAGRPPRPGETGRGCVFAPRCPCADAACREQSPTLREVSIAHRIACLRV